MNYGQYETERRLKSLSSKTGKYTSKLVFNIFKAFFILFLSWQLQVLQLVSE